MTVKNALLALIIALTLIGCKSENTEVLYDCQKKNTNYSASGEMKEWYKWFHLNRRIARTENSSGDFTNYRYDGNGNQTLYETNNMKIVYEYNSSNQLTRQSHFFEGQLDCYYDYIYNNILLDKVLYITNTGDTTISRYYYSAGGQLDSVVNNYSNCYYYYAIDYRRILLKQKNGQFITEIIFKFQNSIHVESEYLSYNTEGNLSNHTKCEYNLTGNLIKATYNNYGSSFSSYYVLYQYNTSGNLEREVFYDAENNLSQYSVYIYENSILKKIESFTSQHELQMFTIVEGHCETIEPNNKNFKHRLIPQSERMYFNEEELPSTLNPFIFNNLREKKNGY
jgi:hypothetical protein